jgi:hypothetical protein
MLDNNNDTEANKTVFDNDALRLFLVLVLVLVLDLGLSFACAHACDVNRELIQRFFIVIFILIIIIILRVKKKPLAKGFLYLARC